MRDRAARLDPSGLTTAASLDPGGDIRPGYHLITEGLIAAANKLGKPRSKPATTHSIPGPGLLELTKFDLVSKVGAGTVETM